jgi:hypothetical protein
MVAQRLTSNMTFAGSVLQRPPDMEYRMTLRRDQLVILSDLVVLERYVTEEYMM